MPIRNQDEVSSFQEQIDFHWQYSFCQAYGTWEDIDRQYMYLIHNNSGSGIYSNVNRSFTRSVNEQFKNKEAKRLSSKETDQLYSVVQTVGFNNKVFGSIESAYENALTKQSNNVLDETSPTRPNNESTKKQKKQKTNK